MIFCSAIVPGVQYQFHLKLKRKGQRASQPEEFWRVFLSLLSDSAAVTAALCSRGRIKRA